MRKLLILTLLVIGFFSCNRKLYTFEPAVTYTLPCDTLDVVEIFEPIVDTLGSIYGSGTQITIDTGDGNRIDFYSGTTFRISEWQSKQDTSDIIVKYVFNWEEGEIETIAGKIVHVTSRYGIWTDTTGKPIESKLFKVKDGVWIPVEWPSDIINVYIRPKK
jgi:hypothetical protein